MFLNPTKIILSASFWTPIMPLVTIIAVIFLVIDYWAAKYHLLRRSFKAGPIYKDAAFSMFTVLEFSPIFFGLGVWFMEWYWFEEVSSKGKLQLIIR
jgi:hypothetical protein